MSNSSSSDISVQGSGESHTAMVLSISSLLMSLGLIVKEVIVRCIGNGHLRRSKCCGAIAEFAEDTIVPSHSQV